MPPHRLVCSLVVRNEVPHYLRQVLEHMSLFCEAIVVLDDASDDGTPELCASFPKVILHRNPAPTFWEDESRLRFQLWNLTLESEPEWVLSTAADEFMEDRFIRERDEWLSIADHDVIAIWLHHFWDDFDHYRVDGGWEPQPKRMLIRIQPGFSYEWDDFRLHSERLPRNVPGPVLWSGLRAKHFGYVHREDRLRKYRRYKENDPDPEHTYALLLDEDGKRERWED